MEQINSKIYWDARFAENWESYSGPDQSRFFARLAIRHLPEWLITLLRRESLTLADWGCAQGDGTDEWAAHLDSQQLTGIDFSPIAIQQATQRYPAIHFMVENWLTEDGASYGSHDIVFSSNVIEHFHKPYDVLKALCGKARKAVVLALPYREMSRHEEHFFTFLPNNIPVSLPSNFRLMWSQVVDCTKIPNTRWMGDQIILVYANTQWMDSLSLTLADCLVEQEDVVTDKVLLNAALKDREAQIAALNLAKVQQESEWQVKLTALQNELRQVEQMWVEKAAQQALTYSAERSELQTRLDALHQVRSILVQEKYEQAQSYIERQHVASQESVRREWELNEKFRVIQNELSRLERSLVEENNRQQDCHAAERGGLQSKLNELQQLLLTAEKEKFGQSKIYLEQQFAASQAHAASEREFDEQLVKANQVLQDWKSVASSLQMEIDTLVKSKFWQKTAILRKMMGWQPNLGGSPTNITPVTHQEKELVVNMQFNGGGKMEMGEIEDLLSLYGESFVRGAYQSLLGRHADPQGLTYYSNRLKRGDHKLKILSQMRKSTEAEKFNAKLIGMDAAIRRYKLAQLPFMGWIRPAEERIENKLRMIEDRLSVLSARQDTKLEELYQLPEETSNKIETLKSNSLDLTWGQFEAQVLLHRAGYKGIFIQELVIDWNVPLYQRPQHIASAFGRLGYLVIYRTANWGSGDNLDGVRQVAPNVWMTSLWEPYNITDAVHSIYSTAYFHDPSDIKNRIKDGVIIYEYIDHIDPQISGEGETIKQLLKLQEWAFGGGADFVVASAKKLEAESIDAVGKEKVILAQNGVDTRHYRNPIHLSTPLPENLIFFRKKYSNIVGYFGALAPWLWYEVIAELVKARPDLGFVFIGPDYYGGSEKLPKAENVLYLGTVDYKILPAYARQFDVCFIPFAPGEIAHTTSPLKLFEYFALEKPVVVTSEMLECVAFKEVFSGDSSITLSQAIDAAIKIKNDSKYKLRLARLADENDWDERARAMESIFGCKQREVSLGEVQNLIAECHRLDGLNQNYYRDAYKDQEELYWRPALQWIMELPSVASVMDIGAAYGTLLTFTALNKRANVLHAVDPVGYMSPSLKSRFNVVTHPVDFERCDVGIDEKFDLVIFTEVIEHLNFNPAPTLLKLKRLIREGGRLIVTTPDADEWGKITEYYPSLKDIPVYTGQNTAWVDGHIWQYTKDEIEDVFNRAGFVIEKFDYSPGVTSRHLCYLLKAS